MTTTEKTLSKNILERLKAQRAKIEARIQVAEARFKTVERKKDTRKKILLGSYYLDQAVKENTMQAVRSLMDHYLKRDSDRALFDLPLLGETK